MVLIGVLTSCQQPSNFATHTFMQYLLITRLAIGGVSVKNPNPKKVSSYPNKKSSSSHDSGQTSNFIFWYVNDFEQYEKEKRNPQTLKFIL